MPVSSEEEEFVSYVVDMLQSIGPVYSKRMFGGYGIFLEGLMFALIADNELYLKVDKESERDFTDRGLEPFTYNKKGKLMKMSYYQAPEEALEDSEIMNEWGNNGYSAALRAAAKKK
jgi:DNA transformation protein